jgi:heat-inducible transcriptional repressor
VTQLSGRARKILFAAVTEYIATGQPVGSRTLARRYAIDLSPATIRNVLADLEQGGLLRQPHTSAGRVPTEPALRAFIEALTEFQEVPQVERRQIQERLEAIFTPKAEAGRDALRRTGKLVSELSGAAAIVASSTTDARKLSQLRFITTKPDQMLAVLVFSDGMVENRFIRVDAAIDENDLLRIHNLLADVVEGRTLAALGTLIKGRLSDQRSAVDRLRRQAFELADRALGDLSWGTDVIVIEGRARLMDLPEYGDVERLKGLLLALEDREHLVELIDKTVEAGVVTVYIGGETSELGDAEISLVAAPYGDPDKGVGTVGVLGPKRMDYAKMMPLVDATASAITAVLKKG